MTQSKLAMDAYPSWTNSANGEVDVRAILTLVYSDKVFVILFCIFFGSLALGSSFLFSNIYKSSMILAPAQKDGGGQLGALTSQFGGLAALAGISVGKEADKTEQALALIKSWPFLENVINKYDLGPALIAAKSFDKTTKQVTYKESLYNAEEKEWVASSFKNSAGTPSSWILYKKMGSSINVSSDKKTGLITISLSHLSPVVAKEWLELLVREVNLHFQRIDKEDAKRNINYLQEKIVETSVAEMQNVFFNMIEAQMKVLMLTERSDDYLFRVVVRPMVPEEKDFPKRILFLGGGVIVGFILWCCSVAIVGRGLNECFK